MAKIPSPHACGSAGHNSCSIRGSSVKGMTEDEESVYVTDEPRMTVNGQHKRDECGVNDDDTIDAR